VECKSLKLKEHKRTHFGNTGMYPASLPSALPVLNPSHQMSVHKQCLCTHLLDYKSMAVGNCSVKQPWSLLCYPAFRIVRCCPCLDLQMHLHLWKSQQDCPLLGLFCNWSKSAVTAKKRPKSMPRRGDPEFLLSL